MKKILITPDLAKKYLAANVDNRSISRKLVAQFSRNMLNGNWADNGQTIVLDHNGDLIDGQHRLSAIVMSGCPQTMIVVEGIQRKDRDTIDAGRARTAGDNLRMAGMHHVTATAAAARLLIAAKSGVSYNQPSTREIFSFLDKHPEIVTSAAAVSSMKSVYTVIPHRVLVPWHFLINNKSTRTDLAQDAIDVLVTGVPSYKDDAIHSLRERAIKASKHEFSTRDGAFYFFSTMNAAWNNFITQTPIRNTKIRTALVQISGFNMADL